MDEVSPKSRFRKLLTELSMRKSPGMRARRSLTSVDMGVSGRELRTDSILMMMLNCSKVSNSLPTIRLKWCLNDFTAASHNPAKCGE